MKFLKSPTNKSLNGIHARRSKLLSKANMPVLFAFLMVLVPDLVLASTLTAGDLGNNAGDNAVGLTSGARRLFGFVGICLVGFALLKGKDAKNNGETIGKYVGTGIIGAALFSVVVIISIANNSLLGTDASQDIQGQIIQ